MEESNIRWGEIIGGLLIIGCSTALVVSLWSQISEIPVVKFLIFTTVTAALFGTVPAAVLGGVGTIAIALLWMKLFPTLRHVEKLE